MKNRIKSRSGALLLEILLMVGIFVICCGIGMNSVVIANKDQQRAQRMSEAVIVSENIAESFKAGDDVLSGCEEKNGVYEKREETPVGVLIISLKPYTGENDTQYLTISIRDESNSLTELTCARIGGGEQYE